MTESSDLERAVNGLPLRQAIPLLRALRRQEDRARTGGDPRLAAFWRAVADVVDRRCEVEDHAREILRGRRRFE